MRRVKASPPTPGMVFYWVKVTAAKMPREEAIVTVACERELPVETVRDALADIDADRKQRELERKRRVLKRMWWNDWPDRSMKR